MEHPDARPATYQDILDLPETLVGEIINGRLVAHPRLAVRPLQAKYQLSAVLAFNFGYEASAEPGADTED
jgi:hypothetical protein